MRANDIDCKGRCRCSLRVAWMEPRRGEKLGISYGVLVAKIEKLADGRYRLTRVVRGGNGKVSQVVRFARALRAVHSFRVGVEQEFAHDTDERE